MPRAEDPEAGQSATGDIPLILDFGPGQSAPWPPLPLVHPAFGTFLDNLHGNSHVTPKDAALLAKLCRAAVEAYDAGKPRASAMLPLLKELLGTGTSPAVVLSTGGHTGEDSTRFTAYSQESDAAWGFGECTNHLRQPPDSASRPADAYVHYWASRRDSAAHQHTCCPALIIELLGPYIRVSAAAYLHCVMIQPLTPLIHLLPMFEHDAAHMTRAAAALAALRIAAAQLSKFYDAVEHCALRAPSDPAPSLESLRAQGASLLRAPRGGLTDEELMRPHTLQDPALEVELLQPPGKHMLLYRVRRPRTADPCIVKFARRYGADVHRAWAAHNCAPALHRFVALPGGWHQVEMEELLPSEGWRTLAQAGSSGPERAAAGECLQRAHSIRVGQGVGVHGDLKDNNVMVRARANPGGSPERGGADGWADRVPRASPVTDTDVKFIDFDWAGEDGSARYPIFINPAIAWPAGVSGQAVMRQAHDVALLRACHRHDALSTRAIKLVRVTASPCRPSRPAIGRLPGRAQLRPLHF